jgi:hypothetical protein
MSPVQGLVRYRKHQFGRQADSGIATAASRAYPFSGTPEVDRGWTDPEVDEGSLDMISAPRLEIPTLGATLNDPQVNYNSLPLMLSAFFGGEVVPTGGGTAKTWPFTPESLTVDPMDKHTYEFGDDVLTDWYQFVDGILTELTFTIPDGLGAVTADMTWKFGDVRSTGSTDHPVDGTVPTPDLNVEKNPAIVYGKDLSVFIADAVAGLGAGQILDAFHGGEIVFSREVDEKRYANGQQSFAVQDYATASRSIVIRFRFGKTEDTVGLLSESDKWMSDTAVTRVGRFSFTSTAVAQTPSTFYSWLSTFPFRYYTREEDAIGGNTIIVLEGHAFFDADDLDGVFDTTVVNTLAEADLGEVGS